MAFTDGVKIILFGGKDTNNNFFNDIWEYNILNNNWTQYTCTGTIPEKWAGLTLSYIGNYKIILFNGNTYKFK